MNTDNLLAVISEARKNKYSLVPSLSENDAICIWESTCRFIQKQLVQLKGVTIPGLGFFSFSQIKLNVGRDKVIVIQRPIFILSECFIRKHNLTFNKQYVSGRIPLISLNYTVISNETHFNRDSVELCIKEIVLAISRCISSKGHVQLDFNEVGRLSINGARAKTKFFRAFINMMDGSGQLENAFRPHTAESEISLMTNPVQPRLSSSSGLALPRIIESTGNEACGTPLSTTTNGDQVGKDTIFEQDGPVEDHEISAKECNNSERHLLNRQLIPKPVSLVSSRDGCTNASLEMMDDTVIDPEAMDSKPPMISSVLPCCSHESMTGQELCYLCHQRDQRSVYVDVSGEKREREQYYEKILHEYKDRKNNLGAFKERQAQKISQMYSKDTSSYNMDLAKQKAAQKSRSKDFQPSHIFQQRPLTPPQIIKHMEYRSELNTQVMKSQEHLKEIKDRMEKVDRDEQNQLAKRLAHLQEAYLKEKAARVAHYRKALSDQVCVKLTNLYKEDQTDVTTNGVHPVFGIYERSEEKRKQQKEINREILMKQLAIVADKQEKAKEKLVRSQQEAAEMLRRTRRELVHDIRASNHKRQANEKELVESWKKSMNEKKQHLLEEFCDNKKPSILLLQQCDKYKRCHRCHRRKDNPDGHLAHSRLVV